MQSSDTDDLPRVLLENYVMLTAALENQNWGRVHDMLQYLQRVHQNLLQVVQQIEDAPAVAVTINERPDVAQQQQQQQEQHQHQQQQQQERQQQQQQQQGQQQQKDREQHPPAWRLGINQPVEQLLQELGLLEYLPILQRERIDMAALLLMQEQHFRHLGLPVGAILKIQAALAHQQEQQQQQQLQQKG